MTEINPRRDAFVRAYADPSSPTFDNATRSMLAVNPNLTYGSAAELGSRELKKIESNGDLRATLEAAGLTPALVAGHWVQWMADSNTPGYRSPAVRTSELAARALGMLSEATVNVDARSILIPGAGALSEAQLLELLERAEAEGSDKLSG